MYTSCTRRMASGEARSWLPVIGTIGIDSTPPPLAMSCVPVATAAAALAMACRPLEQKRG